MKILSWMQRKLDRKHGTREQIPISSNQSQKEEFSDWPHGLLAIGTFGNINLKEEPNGCNSDHRIKSPSRDHPRDITPEEVGQLPKDLKCILHKQVSAESSLAEELETHNLEFNNSIDPSSLEDDRTTKSGIVCGDLADKEGHLQHNTSVILRSGKDTLSDQSNNNAIGKKSFSFLLKKMFLCHNGFAPPPSLRDPPLPQSRKDKILRAILHKKIYPQNSSSKATTNKYLENKYMPEMDTDDEAIDKADDGSKWVKTDSEYIVLEI